MPGIYPMDWEDPRISPREALAIMPGEKERSYRDMAVMMFVDLGVQNERWCCLTVVQLRRKVVAKHGRKLAPIVLRSIDNLIRNKRIEVVRIPRYRVKWLSWFTKMKLVCPTTFLLDGLQYRKLKFER
jgi:hypothetical protein